MNTTALFEIRGRTLHVVFMAILLTSAGCDRTEQEWASAQRSDTREAYEAFIAAHSDDPLTVKAREKVVEIDWKAAQHDGTAQGLTAFVEKWPRSPFNAAANEKLSLLEWAAVIRDHNPKQLYSFLRKWPKDHRSTDLQKEIDSTPIQANNLLLDKGGTTQYMGLLSFSLGGRTEFTGKLGSGEPVGPLIVYVFREIPQSYAERLKSALPQATPGDAYVWIRGMPPTGMAFLRRVDLSKSDEELARDFAVSSEGDKS